MEDSVENQIESDVDSETTQDDVEGRFEDGFDGKTGEPTLRAGQDATSVLQAVTSQYLSFGFGCQTYK